MNTAQISLLLDPFLDQPLSQIQLEQISIYIDLLLRWNARINLTAIRKEDEIVTRHFGESFFLARQVFPTEARGGQTLLSAASSARVVDIGSGAGFPGLPLKLWAPQIKLTLIESNHKKAAFLREVVRELTLTNVDVITDRAESIAGRDEYRANVVTLRAVENFETALPLAAKFLAAHGTLALLIGAAQVPSLGTLSGIQWREPIPIPESRARVLSIGVHP
ncbi:MAG TPA: 16S rRNA (guanine(527)-N(7))-methyltransferase RsmG [Terriglobales bacterium]|nr:16S rRNA (guanine(527)-N(7))-methyltransferase RsmG [Terriglobales bacterium]